MVWWGGTRVNTTLRVLWANSRYHRYIFVTADEDLTHETFELWNSILVEALCYCVLSAVCFSLANFKFMFQHNLKAKHTDTHVPRTNPFLTLPSDNTSSSCCGFGG